MFFGLDEAGLEAVKKVINKSLGMGLNIRVANLGKYKDPGEIAIQDKTAWVAALKNSLPVLDWYFNLATASEKEPYTADSKKRIAQILLPVLKILSDPIEQSHYAGELALKLKVNEKTIWDALDKIKVTPLESITKESPVSKRANHLSPEERLLGLFLVYKKVAKKFQDHPLYKRVQEDYNNTEITVKKRALIEFQIQKETQNLEEEDIETEIKELLHRLTLSAKEKIKEEYALKMKEAEKGGDKKAVKALLSELMTKI